MYPYCFHTEKQTKAMKEVGVAKPGMTIRQTVRSLALQLLTAE